jgi:hypothetical protein
LQRIAKSRARKTVQELAKSAPRGKVYGIIYSEDMVQLSKKLSDSLIKQDFGEIKLWSAMAQ